MGTYNKDMYIGAKYKKMFREKWTAKQKAFEGVDLKGLEISPDEDEKTLFIACTHDEYELPVAVCGSAWELSQVIGMRYDLVLQYIAVGKRHLYRIEVD